MARFKAYVDREAKLDIHPYTAGEMQGLADEWLGEIKARILSGLNVRDEDAKPLSPKYARFKQRQGGSNIRDWYLSGRTMGSLHVISADEHGFRIGFTDPTIQKRVAINQTRDQMFGASPDDKQKLAELRAALRRR